MTVRIIAFICGAIFGGGGALVALWLERSDVWWSIVGLAAVVMGLLAALFGRRFWDAAIGLWPS